MSKNRFLTLIAPRIGPALTQAIADSASRWPQLARFAGRGSIDRAQGVRASSLRPWQAALLHTLGLQDSPERYPSAAVTRSGDIGAPADGFWMHALPMHFSAGLNRLSMMMLQGEGRMTHAERAALEPTIAAHLRTCGLELLTTASDHWLIRSERTLDVATVSPEAAVAGPLDDSMPRGRDAASLRRLMTELQMLLHEHPANVQRELSGLPEINGLWLYGEGSLVPIRPASLPECFGDDAYLRGVYRLNGQTVDAAPVDAKTLLSRMSAHAVIAVIETADLDTLEALWLAPLARALSLGSVARLDLVLEAWRVTIHRAGLLRIWRRQRSPSEWGA